MAVLKCQQWDKGQYDKSIVNVIYVIYERDPYNKKVSDIVEKISSTGKLSSEDIGMIRNLRFKGYHGIDGKALPNDKSERAIAAAKKNASYLDMMLLREFQNIQGILPIQEIM